MKKPAPIAVLLCSLCLAWIDASACARHARAQEAAKPEAAAALFVRTDSDTTTVISPRLRAKAPLNEQISAEILYAVDVWTSASVDIVASASTAVTEQRDELDATVTHQLEAMRLSGTYRFSTEPDYSSHALTLGLERDFAEKATVLAASGSLSFDEVGRAGEHAFSEPLRTLGFTLGATQILDPSTLVQLQYELSHARGFLSSPYRFIGIGSDDATCRGSSVLYCVPETSPDLRVRHAIALSGRRALGDAFSVGAGYRFYLDSWDLSSHTLNADVAFTSDALSVLTLRYRFYTQGAAEHYRASYAEETDSELYTRDKELSPLSSQRIALDAERSFVLDARGNTLRAVLSLGPVFYSYSDYKLLDSITAFDATISMVLEL